MWCRYGFRWSSSVALALLVATAAEARELRFRVVGGVSATSGIDEHLGPSLDVGVSYPLTGVLMAAVELGVERLPSGWGSGQGAASSDFVPVPAPIPEKTTLLSMIARMEVLPRGRDLAGPVLSAGLGGARFRHNHFFDGTDGGYESVVDTRLAGEVGAGVNIPVQSVNLKLLFHAADFLNGKDQDDYEIRWRSRLQVEF